MMTTMQID